MGKCTVDAKCKSSTGHHTLLKQMPRGLLACEQRSTQRMQMTDILELIATAGNRTPASCVTGRDTNHYTMATARRHRMHNCKTLLFMNAGVSISLDANFGVLEGLAGSLGPA